MLLVGPPRPRHYHCNVAVSARECPDIGNIGNRCFNASMPGHG
jgi:hypothetical protein